MTSSEDARVVRARRRARGLGLTMYHRGAVITLRRDGEVVLTGGVMAVEVYLDSQKRRKGQGLLTSPWDAPIADYCLSLAAAGQTAPTIKTRRYALAHVARCLRTPVEALTAEQLVRWFGQQAHWKTDTRRSYRNSVRGFMAWAGRPDLVDALPAVRVAPAAAKPVPDPVWEAAVAAADPRLRLAMRLAGELGLRRSEIAQVHSRDLLDSTGGAQLIVHGKGQKVRLVPVTDSLAAVLRAGAAGHTPGAPATGWLFPNRLGGHLRPQYLGQMVSDVLPEGYSAHKLRHRFATRAYRGSRNIRAVQVLLGHSSVATTERYTAVDDDEIRAAMASASAEDSERPDDRPAARTTFAE